MPSRRENAINASATTPLAARRRRNFCLARRGWDLVSNMAPPHVHQLVSFNLRLRARERCPRSRSWKLCLQDERGDEGDKPVGVAHWNKRSEGGLELPNHWLEPL